MKNPNIEINSDSINILLVDDLKENLLALEALLRRDDLKIVCARSGAEALEFMIRQDFALAFLDVRMPDMSGFELAELMRGTKKTKSIPIIFVTATAKDQHFSFKGYESGAVDFLTKPLDSHAVKNKANIFIEMYRQKQALRKIQNELEQAVRMRDEFMSIASHELKTPLTSLHLQTQLRKRHLKKGDLSKFTAEYLLVMFESDERQVTRITHLIDDMLDISRISSGKLTMYLEEFDLCALVKELIEQSMEQFSSAGCSVTFKSPTPVNGSWDRFRIEQVVMNLFTNAMRYGTGEAVQVEVFSQDNLAQIVVRNLGRGIAKENHERIFQRFERVKGTEITGLGLGLYIVRQILEAHGGTISVESELGKGASFRVSLPLCLGASLNNLGTHDFLSLAHKCPAPV